MKNKIVVGITGASGSIYSLELIKWLTKNGHTVELIASDTGKKVFEYETGFNFLLDAIDTDNTGLLKIHSNDDLFSPLSSGSYGFDAVIIAPCSMGTLGRLAASSGSKLIERVCDVSLKERRRLVIMPRETPLNKIHLKNMLSIAEAGAIVVPAMPAFYHKPESLKNMIDFMVSKLLDAIDMDNDLYKRWK
ncbi:MAG: UbiX family flavin prenyltransferase [Deltaproteobacteria bacterium]|nr:UbiX family flavin prenyltransferase [Deltaproteobacteria bacterium]MCL5791478.1 UbiX family flavin prenyltransferase [Deltaproteobacteria bacterium]